MVFVNSMSDLFHPDVPDRFIIQAVSVMMSADWHIYQVLTKRSQRLHDMLNGVLRFATEASHIWWGVSVENMMHGKPRIEHVRSTPATIKFLSVEPLLEDIGIIDLTGIKWVIVGGESGRGARPMEQSWVEGLLAQCRTARVPFFFKQWGGVQKKRYGRLLRGRTYDEFPVTKRNPIPDRAQRLCMAANLIDQLKDGPWEIRKRDLARQDPLSN
jgi:protein gp37